MIDYRSSLPERTEGTCEWILKNPEYKSWIDGSQASFLWVTGHPGSGKTTLSSYIATHLESEEESIGASPMVCSFFCNEGIENQRDAQAILRSIIFQILSERRGFVRHVKAAFDLEKDRTWLVKSFDRLWSMFTNIVCDEELGTVIIVIDAMDECEKSSRSRLLNSIVKYLDRRRSTSSPGVKFLVTSRPYVSIAEFFVDYHPQRISLEETQDEIDGDLRLVIAQHVRRIARGLDSKGDEIALLESHLNEKAGRTFLWAKFALDILDEELDSSPGSFHQILADLPPDLEATYERFLRKVHLGKEDFAANLLCLIIATFRPLSLDEINVATSLQRAVKSDCRDLKTLNVGYLRTNIRADIYSTLGPLVRISDSKVYLVHLSLKEYLCQSIRDSSDRSLARQYHIDMSNANLFTASACMNYLTLDDFSEDQFAKRKSSIRSTSSDSDDTSQSECQSGSQTGNSETSLGIFGNLLQENEDVAIENCASLARRLTLIDYSARYWAKHFAQSQDLADQSLQDLALRITDKTSPFPFLNWTRFFWTRFRKTELMSSPDPSNLDQFTLASLHDHYVILDLIIRRTDIVEPSILADGLFWAACNGNFRSVIKILTTNVDVMAEHPLCSAAGNGHLDVVKALAADGRVDINSRRELSGSPLSFAAESGHIEIVKFLLSNEHGKRIEVNIENFEGETPLFLAVSNRHSNTTQILLKDSQVDVNHVNHRSETPFSCAAKQGDAEIVALLLKIPDIDVDLPSNPQSDCRTPVAFAAAKGHSEVIRQLWRAGKLNVSHSHRDSKGRNAFALAAWSGHDAVIKRLLRYKMPGINEEDENNWTPLFWALESPRSSTVDTLLKSGEVAVNHRDHSGRTALSWTVSYGNLVILRLLLDAPGIDPLVKDNEGLTSLDYARRTEGRKHIAPMLEDFLQHKR